MFASLLIANRGEIARRIIRTARRLGVRTIAVHSEADANAPHVREADQAVAIGPAPARESYLVGARLIEAAKATGAQAIHPGYGFLSENADFAQAVIDAGLIWVGPPPSAIRAMGLKDAAKALMAKAGVPVTPGYMGDDQSAERLAREAEAIGYPVLIKAVAGGGGKGMRKVDRAEDFEAALASCRREAAASFGDERVLLETYVSRPRHIEVQVFADRHGEVVHLFERDCSLQRRHQKVIEEAPAPGMDEATRAAVCAAAVQAARAVGYEGAGTVEFIADGSAGLRADRIWFMEMNTRLQVEHPVTEMVTGQDLVEWQLRVAAGEPLPLAQDQITLTGWAMEARLYAESPVAGFLPSTGPLTRFRLPRGVRVDSAVEEGGEVSAFYDPMIAKLITSAATREAAAAQLAQACAEVEVWPVKTNAAFLVRALSAPAFVAGAVDTGLIEREMEALVTPPAPSAAALARAAYALMNARHCRTDEAASPWDALSGFRMNVAAETDVRLFLDGAPLAAPLASAAPDVPALMAPNGAAVVFEEGEAFTLSLDPPVRTLDGEAGGGHIHAPMPGKVTAVRVAVGDPVAKGAALVTLEAMKMEHTLVAAFDGVVREVVVTEGAQVSEGALLVMVEA